MMSEAQDDLRSTLQDLRQREFPSVPAEFVDAVLEAERGYEEDREAALRRVRDAVDRSVSAMQSAPEGEG